MMQFFAYEHLPPHLQEVSKPFSELADWMRRNLPANEERDFAFRKLLEAKDCAVRARLQGAQTVTAIRNRPTIDELEAILKEGDQDVEILPSGEVCVKPKDKPI